MLKASLNTLNNMDALDFLDSHEKKSDGNFIRKAQYIKDNWVWLKYSYAIAIKVRRRMEQSGMTQKQLAEALGCTQQHISVILNGRVNMTLETISKLEAALDIDLISSSLTTFDASRSGYLNQPSPDDPPLDIDTAQLVDGYAPRKKKGPKPKR